VDVTVFPEPYKAAALLLRAREPVVVRGRVDDSDKGRVVLAEDVRPLEQSMASGGRAKNGGEPTACRVRVRGAEAAGETLNALRRACEEHAGTVPVFLHVLLPGHEVVVRARGVAVDATADLVAKLDTLLGAGAAVIEYAGRA